MAEEKYTRCPACRTVFRVTAAQLAMREGQVRCGHCRTPFDGIDCLVSLAPSPGVAGAADDEADHGPPTVTLRDYRDVGPAASAVTSEMAEAADRESEIAALLARAEEAAMRAPGDAQAQHEPPAQRAAPTAAPPRPPEAASRSVAAAVLYGVVAAVLVAALAAQALFHYRDWLVARFPAVRPAFAEVCARLGCAVRPPREITELAIQSSDLQADPAHKGLLTLAATLRNRGRVSLAYPHLELTLTDAQDQVVARRALPPADYAGGTADLAAGIPPNAEVSIKVFIDASATTQAGYRLYLFYP
jgi:predicted Zn finger-like uncharacterized protein